MEFYGLVGEKLSHSLSPEIHNSIFKELSIEAAYKLFEIPKEDLSNLSVALKVLKIKGVNVTIPYKKEVMELLDFISDEAKKIGAVNTILLDKGYLKGYNTDYYGFKKMLEINNIEVRDKVVAVLGNGGAAKAIITYLLDEGVNKLYLVSRSPEDSKAEDNRVKLISYEELENITGDVLINTTPVGMYPKVNESPVSKEIIEKFNILVDIIYNPGETKFLSIGKALGKKVCGGLYMLVGQAVKAEEIWQDREIDNSIVNNIYEELKKQF